MITRTAAEWLTAVAPAPPPALASRLRAQLVRCGLLDATATPEVYLDAAEALLDDLLDDGCASRDSALDLLVADAFVTYAFELASDEPTRLAARAEDAMHRIASLAEREPT
jgi:hypothetical protein